MTRAGRRAGIRTLLAEIDCLSPDAILREAASIELRRVVWGRGAAVPRRQGSRLAEDKLQP